MSFQTQLVEYLKENGQAPITKIAHNLGTSVGYVRTQLRALEYAGTIERVDERTPIYYRLSPNSPIALLAERIENAEKALLLPGEKTKSDPVLSAIKAFPKAKWPEWGDKLIALGSAIKQLEDKGLLVDTL